MANDRLTLKQENFARNVASGLDLTAAYRKVYNVKSTASLNNIYVSASKLAGNPKVALRIKQLRDEYGDTTPLTSRDEQLSILIRMQSIAASHLQTVVDEKAVFNKAAADTIIRTAEAISKMCGFNEPEQVDSKISVEFVNRFEEDLVR